MNIYTTDQLNLIIVVSHEYSSAANDFRAYAGPHNEGNQPLDKAWKKDLAPKN